MSSGVVGQIKILAGDVVAPRGWIRCDGSPLSIASFTELFQLIGTYYGGDGVLTFCVPDLRCRIPLGTGEGPDKSYITLGDAYGTASVTLKEDEIPAHTHTISASTGKATSQNISQGAMLAAPQTLPAGQVTCYAPQKLVDGVDGAKVKLSAYTISTDSKNYPQQHSNLMPTILLTYIMCINGELPPTTQNNTELDWNYDAPFLGEIRAFAGPKPPDGWIICDGRKVSGHENGNLYSVIGNKFGGTDIYSYGVPDLRGRAIAGSGSVSGGAFAGTFGEMDGTETVPLDSRHVPPHTHDAYAGSIAPRSEVQNPTGSYVTSSLLLKSPKGIEIGNMYTSHTSTLTPMNDLMVSPFSCQGNAHENMQPYVAMNFCICADGAYPH